MNPLDLIFFKGTDYISKIVMIGEDIKTAGSDFSHVGIIVNSDLLDIPELVPGILYIMESTCSTDVTTVNVLTGKRTFGVQIRPLIQAVNDYKNGSGKAAWSKLVKNPFLDNKTETVKTFTKMFTKYSRSFYDMNMFDLMGTVVPCIRPIRNIVNDVIINEERILNNLTHVKFNGVKNWVFCSELVAIAYQYVGLYDDKVVPEDMTPMDILNSKVSDAPIYM